MTKIKNLFRVFVIINVLYIDILTFSIQNNQKFINTQNQIEGKIGNYFQQMINQNKQYLIKQKQNRKQNYKHPTINLQQNFKKQDKINKQLFSLPLIRLSNNIQIKKRLLQQIKLNDNFDKNNLNTNDSSINIKKYSTDCKILNCQQCYIIKYNITKQTEDPNTGQITEYIKEFQYQICKVCKNGFYPYQYKQIKQLTKINPINPISINSFRQRVLGIYHKCVSLQYRLYEGIAVVSSYDIEKFMNNVQGVRQDVTNIFYQYKTNVEQLNVMFIKQGSIIIDFWVQIRKQYIVDASILDTVHNQIMTGDIISITLQEIPYPKDNETGTNNNNTNNQTNPVNKQSFSGNQLLLPIIVAGTLSGFLAIIVIYFLCIRKTHKNQNQQSISNQGQKNPASQSNQHNTSIIIESKNSQNGKVTKKERFQIKRKSQTRITQQSDLIQSMQQLARIQQQSNKPMKIVSEGL